MTVNVQDPFNSYTAAPGATVFPFTFKLINAEDMVATIDGAPIDLGTDFTLTGVGENDGGNLTLNVPLAGGEAVFLQRVQQLDRATDYQMNGDFRSPTVNNDFDRIWLSLQEQAAQIFRSFRLPLTVEGVSAILPAPIAGRTIKWNPAGTALVNSDVDPDQAANDAEAAAQAAELAQAAAELANSAAQLEKTAAELAATQAAASAASIDPANLVHRTGNETIADIKTFTDSPVVPNLSVGDTTSKAANAKLVRDSIVAATPLAATQAEQEAASSLTTFVSPGRQKFHPGSVKAWVLHADVSGTPTIRDSYGLTSITDLGVGTYGYNLSTPFSSGNYAYIGTGAQVGQSSAAWGFPYTTNTTSVCSLRWHNTNFTVIDPPLGSVIMCGDQ